MAASPASTSSSGLDSSTSPFIRLPPGFVVKLYSMMEDSRAQHLIHWNDEGSFVVVNPERLAKEVLPRYFKHNNFTSFVRQLNMYGFHKVNDMVTANARASIQKWEFAHPQFRKGQKAQLSEVRRKVPIKPLYENECEPSELTNDMKESVNLLSYRLLTVQEQLKQSKEQMASVWAELSALRHHCTLQQQGINQISQLLMTMFGDDADTPGSVRKRPRLEELPRIPALPAPAVMHPSVPGADAPTSTLLAAVAAARGEVVHSRSHLDGSEDDLLDPPDPASVPPAQTTPRRGRPPKRTDAQ